MLALTPSLIIVAGAIVTMLLAPLERMGLKTRMGVTMAFIGGGFLVQMLLVGERFRVYPAEELLNHMMVADSFSAMVGAMLCAGAGLTVLTSYHYMRKSPFMVPEFFSLLLFALFAMMILAMANELVTAFVALETASVAVYALVGLDRMRMRGAEAAFKYLVLGSFAGAFFIFGTVLVYAQVGSTGFHDIAAFIRGHGGEDLSLLIVGGAFLMVTVMFKIAAFPFHAWSLDVYNGAPTPVTAFLSSTFKIAVFALALRLFLVDFALISDIWDQLLVVGAVATLIVGSLLAVSQETVKRMLVASSIVHSGYLMIAFTCTSLTESEAAPALIFYLIAYFLTAIGAFGILSYIAVDDDRRITFDEFRGFAYRRPALAASMAVFLLSLAGFPSTIGFLGKFYIFTAAIEGGYAWLAVLGVLAAFVSVYYYFRLIVAMYFYKPEETEKSSERFGITGVVIVALAVAVLWGGIGNMILTFFPGATILIEMAKISVASLTL